MPSFSSLFRISFPIKTTFSCSQRNSLFYRIILVSFSWHHSPMDLNDNYARVVSCTLKKWHIATLINCLLLDRLSGEVTKERQIEKRNTYIYNVES